MHIVLLTTEYPGITEQSGGIAEYIRKISTKLADLGYEVSIIVAGKKTFSKRIEKINIISFKSLDYWKGIDGNFFYQSFRVLRILANSYKFKEEVNELKKKGKIDILQSSNYLFPSIFLSNHNFPTISRLSSYAPLLREAYGKRATFVNRIEDWLELSAVNRAFAVISPSRLMRDLYSRKSNKKISIIRTPIDEKFISLGNKTNEEVIQKIRNTKIITYFGSLSRLKGVDLIADIIPDILEKYKDVSFLFIGKDYGIPGYGPIVKYINEKVADSIDRIIIKKHLAKEELIPLIKQSYCCLFPSRIDNLPNACIEAISFGIPVIGSRRSSLEEMIVDNKTGYIFDNSDSKDLKRKIEKMLNLSNREYKDMKENVNILYSEIQSEDRVQKLINYYKKTLNEFQCKK